MRVIVAVVCTAVTLSLAGCAGPARTIQVVGTVDDTTDTVSMPNLAAPAVNLDAGFASASNTGTTDPAAASAAGTASTTATTYGFASTWMIAKVAVKQGDSVRAGQVVATVDTRALAAQLKAAKADRRVAADQLDVLDANLADLAGKADDLAKAKKTVQAAIRTLTRTLSTLKKAQPQLIAARADLARQLASAKDLLAHYPPVPPPGMPTPDQLRAAISKLSAAIAGLDAKLAQIRIAVPKLTSGLAKARTALSTMDTATAKLSDARSTLRDVRRLAGIAADSADVPVALAQVQLDRAVLTAPSAGVVTDIAAVGDQLAPGATVASIRPAQPEPVTAWLSPAQRAQVCVGDRAHISGDWMPAGSSVPATLVSIAPTMEYPPSSTTTDETHLTRAVKVRFTTTAALPPGAPVEISLPGCRPAAGSSEQEK